MLALKIALRELRGGLQDFRIFFGCLIIGVTVIAAVGSLSSRIGKGITEQARTLLGGDVEISLANTAVTSEKRAYFESYGSYSLTVSLRAMAAYGDNNVLVELKGVDKAYPLLGTVQLASGSPIQKVIIPDQALAEQGLLDRLGAKPKDRVTLGTANFTIADVLQKEPDRLASAFGLGPRVIVSMADLEKAGLLLPGGLVKYNYQILLRNPEQLKAFLEGLHDHFPSAPWIVKTSNDNNRTVKNLVSRLQLFMTLAGLSSLLIGGVGILSAIDSYTTKKLYTIAILKALGAKQNFVLTVYLLILFIVTLIGTAISAGLGFALSLWLLPYLSEFFPVSTHSGIDYKPLLLAMMFGMLTVFTFSLAVLGRAVEVKPTLLFRGGQAGSYSLSLGKLVINLLLVAALIVTLLVSSHDIPVAIGFIGSAIVCFMVFAGTARLIRVVAKMISASSAVMRLAFANLARPGGNVFSIMLSIGIGLTVLIALLQVEGNIRREISETIPANAPSVFLIDIQPSQKEALLTLLHSRSYVSDIAYAPMVRGRISRLKNRTVEKSSITSDAKWATESDRGLSYADEPPQDLRLVKGNWWPAGYQGKPLLSIDSSIAKGMGLDVGDSLAVNVLGQEITAEIASLREVNYSSFHINFAMIFSPGALERFPATFIATARINGDRNEAGLIRDISKQFPNMSSIRIKDSLVQVQGIVDNIATAIRITALAALASGLVVLSSALAATLDKRVYETVIMKTLGARRRDIIAIFLAEWTILSVVTGLLASILGSAVAWLIMQRFDWVVFHPLPGAIFVIFILTLVFVITTGLFIQSRVFNASSVSVLRNE